MKTNLFLAAMAMTCALVFGCSKCKDDNCLKDVSITSVLPNSNPVGYEVLLKTSGFSDTAKVVFGSVEASWRPGGATGEIIARVPAGLSGNVEISVEDGDCIARSADFKVLGALPGNVQPSLPDIIIPTSTSSLPTTGVTNQWRNATSYLDNDRNYGIFLQGDLVSGFVKLDSASKEYDNNDLNFGNPVTGTVNTNTNTVYLEIDRRAKAGGTIEKLDGQFIAVPSFLPSDATYAILLVSRETGRQLLIYYAG